MKLLVAHNEYKQPGGEDAVFRSEVQLLRQAGHEVREYVESNHRIGNGNYIRLGAQTVWNDSSRKKLRESITEFRPDVVHFHNIFPLISPAAYSACQELDIPTVQTLHNYRLLCPGGLLYRDGGRCEDCLPKRIKWPGVLHACYRDNTLATAAVATTLAVHQSLGTWHEKVTLFVALSEFSRSKFVQGGLPAEKIVVKPNFVSPDPGERTDTGDYVLFVGRLSAEKGIELLFEAWKKGDRKIPLRIVGDGSEAYACGIPVIASRHGAMAEIIRDAVTGLLFEPGSAEDFAAKIEWAWTHTAEMETMGRGARAEFETKYTGEHNYQLLMRIYEQACSA